jgi:hypothetical protein
MHGKGRFPKQIESVSIDLSNACGKPERGTGRGCGKEKIFTS